MRSRRHTFLLEILSYDATIGDPSSLAYAKVKPHKVIEAMREFSKNVIKWMY